MQYTRILLVLLVLNNSSMLFAQTSEEETTPHMLPTIHVMGAVSKSSLLDFVPTVSELSGSQLMQKRSTSLGETLRNEVGVNSSSYGPTASRPVIRGLDGDRIRILQNGIGVLDASGASQDHAVPIDPMSADRIEIVRGPVTLLYGSSAVGGVVNIVNSRIHSDFVDGFQGALEVQGTTVNSGKAEGLRADYGKSGWMLHTDLNFRQTADQQIPGHILSKRYRELNPGDPREDIKGRLPNSGNDIKSGAFGTSYVGDRGYFGLSGSTFASEYGTVAEPDVRILMRQNRYDLAGELKEAGPFKSIRIKSAQSFYHHEELADGVSGTSFKNDGNESRAEFVQNNWHGLDGIIGLQSNIFQFSAKGDEAFLPTTHNSTQSIFAYEELLVKDVKVTFGGRSDFAKIKADSEAAFGPGSTKSFNTGSGALGFLYPLTETLSTALNVSYNERAPNYQELFANGPHVATGSFEIGDQNLSKERSLGLELSLRHKAAQNSGFINFFSQRFNDFIVLSPTGNNVTTAGGDVLGEYRFLQQNADIYGIEVESKYRLPKITEGAIDFEVKGDYLRGKNRSNGDNLPRISPARVTLGAIYTLKKFEGNAELQQVFKQSNVAQNELPTDAYLQTNMGATYQITSDSTWSLTGFARINNLFNVEARNHVSILKDISTLPGRSFNFGLRSYF